MSSAIEDSLLFRAGMGKVIPQACCTGAAHDVRVCVLRATLLHSGMRQDFCQGRELALL